MAVPHPSRHHALLATIFLLNAIEFLQAGMLSFGAGPIMGEIGLSPEEFTFTTASYACIAITAIAKQRWLVERMGWRQFIQVSLLLFLAGAAVCATAGGFSQFVLGRCIMAFGGAAFMTSARLMVNLIPPGPRRLAGIKSFVIALALGLAAAPWLAAVAVGRDWRLIFGMLSLLAITALGAAACSLPTEKVPHLERSGSHPWLLLSMAAGSFLTLYALQRASYALFSDALPLLLFIILGLLCLAFAVRHQHRHSRPLLHVARLAQPRYLSGLALFTLCYVVLGANNTMLPVLMQRGLGFAWEVIGRVQSVGMLATLAGYLVMLQVMKKWPGARKFYLCGFLALAWFGWQLSRLNTHADLWHGVLPAIVAFGLFIILVMAMTAIHTFTDLASDEEAFAHGQQVKNMLSQFGLGLGIASATLGLQWRTASHYATLNGRFTPENAEFSAMLSSLHSHLAPSQGDTVAAQQALAHLAVLLNQQATLLASLDYFYFVMCMALACTILMWFQKTLR